MPPLVLGFASTTDYTTWLDPKETQSVIAKPYATLNQLLEALITQSIDALALDLKWVQDPTWFEGIFETAAARSIPVILLTHYMEPKMWFLSELHHLFANNEVSSCIQIQTDRENTVIHRGQHLALAPRAQQLLNILIANPGRALTLSHINTEATNRRLETWSPDTLKATVHIIRNTIGPEHIKTIRGFGYIFQNCAADPE